MRMNVVIVAAAVLMLTIQTSGQPTWGCSGPRTEEKCVCSPVIHVHNYGDKQEDSSDTGTSQDVRLAELEEQVRNLTEEVALLKQGRENLVCPNGSVKFQDRCFSFSTDTKNYAGARSACQAAGGHLAMPKDQATNDILRNQLTRYPSGSDAWFGLTDLAQEGTFVWEDGTPLTGWSNWYPGEPNGGSAESCAHWHGSYGYKWNDRRCSHSQYYVCEVSAAVP
ncbi:perlucin-like protein [Branchiostoma floridae]|uniref:Perlucin-like protein n=2 Tax=Branchiostoma floridae TaxID=7739 RepID=A0A9J7M8Z6_BRAFL|nr:perlucin-like protein [Branchiostoma floridae]